MVGNNNLGMRMTELGETAEFRTIHRSGLIIAGHVEHETASDNLEQMDR